MLQKGKEFFKKEVLQANKLLIYANIFKDNILIREIFSNSILKWWYNLLYYIGPCTAKQGSYLSDSWCESNCMGGTHPSCTSGVFQQCICSETLDTSGIVTKMSNELW